MAHHSKKKSEKNWQIDLTVVNNKYYERMFAHPVICGYQKKYYRFKAKMEIFQIITNLKN